jgi:formyl-CoA transferase
VSPSAFPDDVGETNSPVGPGALDGVRVIELGTLIAGPFCGQLLADYGAEVIKVEDPKSGDPMRRWGKMGPGNTSLSWQVIARNKKSITVNLRDEKGQEIVRQLVRHADIVIENFRPGTLERWGLGYETLSQINPRVIMVRVSGFGQDGPYAKRTGFGSIGEAMGGLRYVTGEPDRPPSRIGISIGDSIAATFSTIGALLALQARVRTGRGQVVDTAIYEAVLSMMESLLPDWKLANYQRERTGSFLPGIAPSNLYPTVGGQNVVIGANLDTIFARLCKAMGVGELAQDERFATHQARGQNARELDEIIARWTSSLDIDEVLETMNESGVPAGRIFTAADMFEDPHFAARNAIVSIEHPREGNVPMQNVAPRLSATPGSVRSAAPELGADNAYVFEDILGMTKPELDGLRQSGTI